MSIRSLVLPTSLVLAAGFAFTTPASAFDLFDDDEAIELAQATPPAPPPPQAAPRGERPRGAERGERAERGFSPRSICLDMTARRIGDRAYLKARLELKPDQMTAWNAFEKAADDASAKSMARCQTLPAEMKERPTYLERLTMQEDAMKARIATIEAVKPSLTALVAVLTPEQKALLDRPRIGFGHHGHAEMGRPGPR